MLPVGRADGELKSMNDAPDDAPVVLRKRRWRTSLGCFLALCLLIALGVFVIQAVHEAREAARQSCCQGRLNQLQLALRNYHDVYGSFPPAFMADADGKPMHSWRVLILPFLEQAAVYEKYDFHEPWNGVNNRKLANRIYMDMFHCNSGPHLGESPMTDFVAIVGPGTAFPGATSTSLDDMRDGPENTILLAEIANSNIHWMEPRDLTVSEMSFVLNDPAKLSISSPHSSGPAIVFGDRITAYRLDASLRPQTLRALTTIGGEEHVSREGLARWNEWTGWYLAEQE